ncbi:hypothetical protein RCH22_002060 [Cryobacterium psychrotolerans]|nr:hypothetical protein [Cryobacterium psychrotolerans]
MTSSDHWLRTARTIRVTMPPSTTTPPSRVSQVASVRGTPRARSQRTSGLSAAARMSATSVGITTNLSCTRANTTPIPSTITTISWALRMLSHPSRSTNRELRALSLLPERSDPADSAGVCRGVCRDVC